MTTSAIPVAQVSAKIDSHPATEHERKFLKTVIPLAVAIGLALIPSPSGLPHYAWHYFCIFAGIIVALVLEPLPGAAIAIIGITLVHILSPYVLFSPEELAKPGFRPATAGLSWALSGFSSSTVWLIFGAFMLALGYDRTGLGKRIALFLVKVLGKNTLSLGYGVALADAVLAPFIPSPTARSGGIIYPIVSGLAPMYGSKPNDPSARKVGSYIMWVAIATTCVTSSLFLTAASFNLLAVGLIERFAHVDIRWTDWFRTAAPVIGPMLILLPLLSYWFYPPEIKHCNEVSKWAAGELEKMGGLTRRELILAAIVLVALVLWIAGGRFMTATTVAGLAVCLMLITRVLTWNDMAEHKRAWTTIVWLGALIALSDGLNKVGFVKWFADGIASHMSGFSPHAAMLVLLAVFFIAHYFFASVDAYTTALLPVILVTGVSVSGIPVKEFAILLAMELGIMGVITPFADAASPIYANSGYIPPADYWRLGTIFGVLFLGMTLFVGVPWAGVLWGK